MQRITVPLLLSIAAFVSGTALVSSATQSERSPIPPEEKDAGTPNNPANPHLPLPPVPKEPGSPNDPNGSPHMPIPPEIKGSPSPLPPENFIVINGQKAISSGGAEVVFTVPNDRWLVLTDIETASAQSASAGVAVLSERMGALVTDKRTSFLSSPFHSFVGIAFEPGSAVLLRESTLSSPVTISFSLNGMLVKPTAAN